MTEKELRKLKRGELLEIMVEQAQLIEEQAARIEMLQKQLDDRSLKIENAGSIAEAALALNNVFAAAQAAADEYIADIRTYKEKSEAEMERAYHEAEEIVDRTQERVQKLEADAHGQLEKLVSEAMEKVMRENSSIPAEETDSKRKRRFWRRNERNA